MIKFHNKHAVHWDDASSECVPSRLHKCNTLLWLLRRPIGVALVHVALHLKAIVRSKEHTHMASTTQSLQYYYNGAFCLCRCHIFPSHLKTHQVTKGTAMARTCPVYITFFVTLAEAHTLEEH
uniref:Uncharacterized protein n=1 Tax=Rhipicephalus zambeziensis TaxID=60191 RepID=A0A224Y5D7_9ACAR